jgi:putative Mg2+ transporter-C (MgtC) family protein
MEDFQKMNPWWQRAIEAVQRDFSDLNDPAQLARLVVRLTMAAVLSGILGWQREGVGKAAGLRTHMLVALGAAIYVLAAEQAGLHGDGMSRVLQGLVAGVGFLGAGAILKMSEQGQIRGLTTAAGIWLTAGIGVAAGMGQEASAVLITIFAWITLAIIPRLERRSKDDRTP